METIAWVSAGIVIGCQTGRKKNSSSSSSFLNSDDGKSFERASTPESREVMSVDDFRKDTHYECNGTIFRSIENIPRIHLSMNDVSTSFLNAKLPTTPSEARKRRYPDRTKFYRTP